MGAYAAQSREKQRTQKRKHTVTLVNGLHSGVEVACDSSNSHGVLVERGLGRVNGGLVGRGLVGRGLVGSILGNLGNLGNWLVLSVVSAHLLFVDSL
jgi:hypothetical protein